MIDDSDPKDGVFLSIKDIARRLNVSGNFVYQECVKGHLEHYALGGSLRKRGAIRCTEEQFQHYLSNHLAQKPVQTQTISASANAASITTTANSVSQQLNRLMRKRKQA
ncbi:MAG: hypothetical protein ACR2PX_03695 [Endozoicomonas sp.]|uniref:hypothetical protein n=1 Tax=Endozoicomonas sp. TaxID=1892382 RepID=UPI003D9BACB0